MDGWTDGQTDRRTDGQNSPRYTASALHAARRKLIANKTKTKSKK